MRVTNDTCEFIQRQVKDAEREVREKTQKAADVSVRAQQFISKGNMASDEMKKQLLLLGGKTQIRNTPFRLARGGIAFLEKLDLIDAPKERNAETNKILRRLSALVRDGQVAQQENDKARKEKERAEVNLEFKRKALEECRRQARNKR